MKQLEKQRREIEKETKFVISSLAISMFVCAVVLCYVVLKNLVDFYALKCAIAGTNNRKKKLFGAT